jgi:hypothetical protein
MPTQPKQIRDDPGGAREAPAAVSSLPPVAPPAGEAEEAARANAPIAALDHDARIAQAPAPGPTSANLKLIPQPEPLCPLLTETGALWRTRVKP